MDASPPTKTDGPLATSDGPETPAAPPAEDEPAGPPDEPAEAPDAPPEPADEPAEPGPALAEPAEAPAEPAAELEPAEPASARGARRPWWQRIAGTWLPPLLALLAGWGMIAYRSPYRGWKLFQPPSWGRWDTGHYLHIARSGYEARVCPPSVLSPKLPPGDYLCGTIGWFPGYSGAMRGLAEISGLALPVAAVVVTWTCWYLLLVLMWRLLADARSLPTRLLCLLIAAFAPGQVYFAALFPVSMTIAAMLGCMYVVLRTSSWRLVPVAVGAGLVAGGSYLTAIVLAPALIGTALVAMRGWAKLRGVLAGLSVAAGFGGVLLAMQVSTGIWNAYFVSVKKYGIDGATSPLETLTARMRPLWTEQPPGREFLRVVAAQTLITLCLVGLVTLVTVIRAGWGAVRAIRDNRALRAAAKPVPAEPVPAEPEFEPAEPELAEPELAELELAEPGPAEPEFEPAEPEPAEPVRRARRWPAAVLARLSAFDLAFLVTLIGVWLVPYVAGGLASTYRSEAFAVLGVPLLRRLPPWLLVVPLVALVAVAWHMAPNYFNAKLQ